MAGTFPGIVGTQQFDLNGRPLVGGALTIFDATTNQAVTVYQDYGLTTQAQNPVATDRAGRLPIVYVPDGMYRLRLTDKRGVTSNGGFDYAQVPSIGQQIPQSSNTIDPHSVASVGATTWRIDTGMMAGWVRLNGLTLGNTYSQATERANADCQALFFYAWQSVSPDIIQIVGGRGASAQADWSANKQLILPSMRGRAAVGVDAMGNASAGIITTFSTEQPDVPGYSGGGESHQLTIPEMPTHNHGGGGQTGGQSNDHTHGYYKPNGGVPYVGQGTTPTPADSNGTTQQTSGTSQDHHHAFSIPNDGGSQSHTIMSPFMLVTWFWKL